MQAGVTAAWRGTARAVGRIARWKPSLWESSGGRRVLVVAPHPDDEIGCGGTMLLHHRAGDELHLVHVTDGRGSRTGGLGPDAMAGQRRQEAGGAARALGLPSTGTHWLGLPEWEWEDATLVPRLQDLVRDTRPHIVYAPSRVDFHPEHVRVARCLAQALDELRPLDLTVRMYQMQVPLTPMLVNLVTPIHAVAEGLRAVMECYASQRGSLERCLRMKRYGASFYNLAGQAEEFWEADLPTYVRVHALSPDMRLDGPFRGVRARPFTDPLSYLRGAQARRRLRQLAEEGKEKEDAAA